MAEEGRATVQRPRSTKGVPAGQPAFRPAPSWQRRGGRCQTGAWLTSPSIPQPQLSGPGTRSPSYVNCFGKPAGSASQCAPGFGQMVSGHCLSIVVSHSGERGAGGGRRGRAESLWTSRAETLGPPHPSSSCQWGILTPWGLSHRVRKECGKGREGAWEIRTQTSRHRCSGQLSMRC